MGENMMNSAHKSSNEKSRNGWDQTFGKQPRYCVKCGKYVGKFTGTDWFRSLHEVCNDCYIKETEETYA